jgi:phage baseplate assembly protein V
MADRYDKEITDLKRRVSNSVLVGKISSVDHEKGRYRVTAGELVSDWIPMTTPRAGRTSHYSSFEVGEQVILASPSGDMSQAVIIGAVSTGETQAGDAGNLHRIKYPDGTVVEYDHEAKRYKMDVASGGGFQLNIGGGASIVASGEEITIKGNIKLEGPVEIFGEKLEHNSKNVGDDHEHTGVVPGGGLTGPPA